MSISRRRPIFKERGIKTHAYWRIIRRHQRNNMRSDKFLDSECVDHFRNIINDYFKRDYICIPEQMFGASRSNKERIEWEKIYSRK